MRKTHNNNNQYQWGDMRAQKQQMRRGGFLSSPPPSTFAGTGGKRRPNLNRLMPAAPASAQATATATADAAAAAEATSIAVGMDYEYEYDYDETIGNGTDALLPTTVAKAKAKANRRHFSAPCCRCSWLGLLTILNFVGIVVLAIVVATVASPPARHLNLHETQQSPASLLQPQEKTTSHSEIAIRESASFVLNVAQDGFVVESLFAQNSVDRVAWFSVCCNDRERLVCGATHKKRNLHLFAYLSPADNRATIFTNNPKLQGAVCRIIVAATWQNHNSNSSEKADAL